MPSTCPNGHQSAADDYCDLCGRPMSAPAQPPAWAGVGAGGAASAASAAPETGSPDPGGSAATGGSAPGGDVRACPHCGAVCSASYLFCEDCGYDFTTGALPRPLAEGLSAIDTRVPVSALAQAAEEEPQAAETAEAEARETEATEVGPAESSPAIPEPEAPAPEPQAIPEPEAPAPEPQAIPEPGPLAAAPSESAAPTAPPPDVPSPDVHSTVTGPRPSIQAPSRRTAGDWVVEVWIDPAWFDVQDSDQECPSPGVPDIVRVGGRALVGRYSASRHIVPEVDCGADSGVSRRHAEFSTDGRRWWVEDLGSSNGTFVGPASGPLPGEPIERGRRVEIDDDDRVYVGAWTRLVLRRATASEIAGHG